MLAIGIGILEIGAVLFFFALVGYGFSRRSPAESPPAATPALTAREKRVLRDAGVDVDAPRAEPEPPREPQREPGLIENLIVTAYAKASAARDKAETEAVARRLEKLALRQAIDEARKRAGDD